MDGEERRQNMTYKSVGQDIVFCRTEKKYQSICHGIQRSLAGGRIKPGDQLPPQRELADELGVTLGTVTRAYKELEKLGLLRGETGRGTFIARREIEEFTLHHLHNKVEKEIGGMIRFDLNFPVAEGLPDLSRSLADLSKREGLDELLCYQPTAGLMRHRKTACHYLLAAGLQVEPENLVITTGAQHAIFTALASRLNPGDSVAVDEYTYPGLLNIAGRLHLRLISVSADRQGMRADELAALARRWGIKGVYLIPTMHNPTTLTMGEERRRELAKIIRGHDLFLVEDDVYGQMEEPLQKPIASLIPERSYYVTNLSKTLAPGLRVGYMTVPNGGLSAILRMITATTWMNPPLVCEIASRWIDDGTVDRVLANRKLQVKRRISLLKKGLAGHRLICRPTGLHGWLELPQSMTSESFARQAAGMGVLVMPSSNFATHGRRTIEAVRICIGPPENEAEVKRGAEILASLLSGSQTETAQIM